MNSVKFTTYLSILIQIVSLFIGMYAYRIKVPMKDLMLKDILLIENIVQAVEFTFYLVIGFIITNIPTEDLAKYRYYDWVITTPIMLITTLLFFVYENHQENVKNNLSEHKLSAWEVIKKERKNIMILFLSNLGMLLMGYLQETNGLPLSVTNTIGFILLFVSFSVLYQYVNTPTSSKLFWVMLIIWSLYGVVATFNPVMKNTSYNILDVISKNFYGVFLAILIYRLRSKVE